MTQALLVSNALLWVAVVALAGVVLALVRQIGVLHERLAPTGALSTSAGPRVGEPAPELDVEDWSGRRLHLGGESPDGRSTLLFFLSPTCPVCKALMPVLDSVARAERDWLRVVWASDGARSEHAALVAEHGLADSHFVLSTPLALAYRVGQLPFAVLFDAQGRVRASGLVNTREHLESLFEAQERGVPTLQAWLASRGAAARDVA
jgi:methylamine dehydrogenase accessory protein MauD